MGEKTSKWLRYGICFVLISALCWLFPYTGDDWAWGSQIGIDRLNSWFANYNGRYLGNIFVLIMTRSNVIKTLIMALCLTGTVYLGEYITKKKYAFYVGCVSLALIPKLILKQAVVWTAGFSNYVTSLFLTMIFIAYIYPIFEKNMPKRKIWHCIPMFVLGVANTLIVEHLTIYNVVVAVAVIGYTIFVHRKVIASHVAYATGAVAGAWYMFSNEAYHTIANNEDGYRQMAEGGVVSRALTNYVEVIVKHLVLNNVWINLLILAVCMILLQQCFDKEKQNSKICFLANGCVGVMAVFNVWALLSSFGISTFAKQNRLLYIEALLATIYVLALLVFSVLVGLAQKKLWHLLFWNLSIICVAAPLLVVNPIGERCFFVTYIFFVMLLLELMGQIQKEVLVQFFTGKMFRNACVCIALAGLAFYLNIFSSIYEVDHARLARIQRQVAAGKTSVEIIHLPYESYLWTSTPEMEPWIERYKLFYGLPENLELKAVWEYTKKK